jgi:hypothetical protein
MAADALRLTGMGVPGTTPAVKNSTSEARREVRQSSSTSPDVYEVKWPHTSRA